MCLKIAAFGVCLAVQFGAAAQGGAFREVEQRYRSELERLESAAPTDGIVMASTCHKLALVLREEGRYAEAEQLFRKALDTLVRILGPKHLEVAGAMAGVASVLLDTGRLDEAEDLLRKAIVIDRASRLELRDEPAANCVERRLTGQGTWARIGLYSLATRT